MTKHQTQFRFGVVLALNNLKNKTPRPHDRGVLFVFESFLETSNWQLNVVLFIYGRIFIIRL